MSEPWNIHTRKQAGQAAVETIFKHPPQCTTLPQFLFLLRTEGQATFSINTPFFCTAPASHTHAHTAMAPTTMFTLLAASLAFVTVTAHMHLAYPLPLNFYKVTDRDSDAYDWWIQKGAGPCLGQLGDYDSAPVELTWAAGSEQGFR